MPNARATKPEPIITSVRRRGRFLALGIFLSLAAHALLLFLLPKVKPIKSTQRVPITVEIRKKPKKILTEEERKAKEEKKSIIEAPLMPTEAPDEPAHLGRQNHKAVIEQKTDPRSSAPGADSSALQNGLLKIEGGIPDKEGTVMVPAKQGTKYSRLLPRQGEILNLAHNDFIPDKNLPKGAMLDVNTTDFRWIGYFTSVRKLVELAFTDIGPTLRASPYVKSRLSEVGKASFQGESKIRLKVQKSGLLTETKLISSSGDSDIDKFWDKILNLAGPYPPLPRDFPEEELMFTYTLYYDVVVQNEERTRRFVY